MEDWMYALLIDILLGVTAVILIAGAYRKGFLSMLIRLAGYLIACVGGYLGSRALALTTYQLFLRDKMALSINEAAASAVEQVDLTGKVQAALDGLPSLLQKAVTGWFGGTQAIADQFGELFSDSLTGIGDGVVEHIVYPILYPLLQSLYFLLLFAAIMVVVRFVARAFVHVRQVPIIGTLNALLGALLGAVQALLVFLIAVVAVQLLIRISGNQIPIFNEAVIEQTHLFCWLYDWNLFGGGFSA